MTAGSAETPAGRIRFLPLGMAKESGGTFDGGTTQDDNAIRHSSVNKRRKHSSRRFRRTSSVEPTQIRPPEK
jgi:hypothetical protein